MGIADDFTGASDLALMFAEHGMASSLFLGIPDEHCPVETDAVVVALKSRTSPAAEAIAQSLRVAHWSMAHDADHIYFKYCSTFDSTEEGNIGPVADALLSLLDQPLTIVCPAFPENGRQIIDGRLIVNGVPLADSPMRDHPLTPMRESSLVTLMDAQTHHGATAQLSLETVRAGAPALRRAIDQASLAGYRYLVPDIETDEDLVHLARGLKGMRLVTGASGLALGLPEWFGIEGEQHAPQCASLPRLAGPPVLIAGSASEATRSQLAAIGKHIDPIIVDPIALARKADSVEALCERAGAQWQAGPALIQADQRPGAVRRAQEALGRDRAAQLVEDTLSTIASHLAAAGACKFIIAGGETSGAVAAALGANGLRTGPRIAPGVPWMLLGGETPQILAFKSGNFGGENFFLDAMGQLP